MGDPKRFWKESIGVTGPVGPKDRARRESATGTLPPSARPPAIPEAAPARTPSIPPVQQVLATLPLGSIVFADEVARKLWPNPSPQELKSLAALIEHQHRVPPASRDVLYRCVAIRQRMLRLGELTARATFDTAPLQARGAEWGRLARLARETSAALLPLATGPGGDTPAVTAARELLPEAGDLEALAAVAAEAAEVAESARAGAELDPLPLCGIHDAGELVAAIASGAPRAGDELFLEILAAAHLAGRTASLEVLGRVRRALSMLSDRLEAAISRAMNEHRRDPQRNARLAEWKRCLADLRGRVDEALTRPGGVVMACRTAPLTGPATGAISGPATGVEPTGPASASDDAIRELLGQVRQKAGPGAAEPAPPRPTLGAWIRGFFSRKA